MNNHETDEAPCRCTVKAEEQPLAAGRASVSRKRPAGPLALTLWRKACEFDHVATDSTFLVFSGNNPYSAACLLLRLSPGGSRSGLAFPRSLRLVTQPMEHDWATRLVAAERYLLGELSDAERDQFEEHFFDCPACAEEVRAGAIFEANARAVFALSGPPAVG